MGLKPETFSDSPSRTERRAERRPSGEPRPVRVTVPEGGLDDDVGVMYDNLVPRVMGVSLSAARVKPELVV